MIAGHGVRLQRQLGIFLEPLVKKFLELDSFSGVTVGTLLLEQYRLTLNLFFDLFLRHTRLRFPSESVHYLLAMNIVTARNSYAIGVVSFLNCCHRFVPPLTNHRRTSVITILLFKVLFVKCY